MCQLVLTTGAYKQLAAKAYASQRSKLTRKLCIAAAERSLKNPSVFDLRSVNPRKHGTALRGVQKMRLGSHRIYFKGTHKQCTYRVAWIAYQDSHDSDQIEDEAFRRKLARAFNQLDSDMFKCT